MARALVAMKVVFLVEGKTKEEIRDAAISKVSAYLDYPSDYVITGMSLAPPDDIATEWKIQEALGKQKGVHQ